MSRDALLAKATLVGMVHLPPLTGPDALPMKELVARAVFDARALEAAGFDGVIVENYGDGAWPKRDSPPHVPAIMSRVVAAVVDEVAIPVGVNVLRNDILAALGIAAATGAAFVRANVLAGVAVTDQGLIEGDPHAVQEYRRMLGLERGPSRVLLAADLQVKHAAPLAPRPLEEVAEEHVHRAGADILLVTGATTGRPADLAHVERALRGQHKAPVWVASGVTARTVEEVLGAADGVIVGSALKHDDDPRRPVDPERATRFVQAAARRRRVRSA